MLDLLLLVASTAFAILLLRAAFAGESRTEPRSSKFGATRRRAGGESAR